LWINKGVRTQRFWRETAEGDDHRAVDPSIGPRKIAAGNR
jgi:hypothetical protein